MKDGDKVRLIGLIQSSQRENRVFKSIFGLLVMLVACGSNAAPLASASVSGGSFSTVVDVTTDPAFASFLTTSTGDTFIDLVPAASGPQAVSISLSQINATTEEWAGIALTLDPDASFNSAPALTFGGVFAASVSGPGNEDATLLFAVPQNNGLFFDLDLTVNGNTRITITPLVPEPASGMMGLVGLLAVARRRR